MLEIEMKAWVDYPDQMHARLEQAGVLQGEYHKKDIYFKVPAGADVRIRREEGKPAVLTRKMKKMHNGVEINQEIECSISDSDMVESLLKDLGAREKIRKEKIGRAYSVGELLVELSEVVGLGFFIEIEWVGKAGEPGQVEAVEAMVRKTADFLGIQETDIEPRPYTKMLRTAAKIQKEHQKKMEKLLRKASGGLNG